jgi:hypothetical protein
LKRRVELVGSTYRGWLSAFMTAPRARLESSALFNY